ncbi:molybdenum cofactor guanylyltransferase [Virgibacillus sp. NKC19-3]|uniref:molybdenum cofactor guanylyltransferase n=1 Tax=Virgibacillus saliphilus TaxID=2831674 RepID=UPI001C9B06F4|nr:molybdenum cofactor guanylyltransferase [Virgibacillus sp. NKC19-3]MBY7142079.1 molybdenum cofactor guanylyltransferase [Virgibacillus sp. NKC19-3]
MTRKIQGVILAGGMSRRFGSPKAFAEKDGVPFYYYSMAVLKPFVNSMLIVTNPKLHHLFDKEDENIPVVNDLENYRGQGPLAGIYTAMETCNANWYMVLPVDVPFMESQVIEKLVHSIDTEDVDAVIPVVAGKLQPLVSVFHHSLKDVIKSQLDNGKRAVEPLLKKCKVSYIRLNSEKAFININHQSDYQTFL